MSTPRTMEFAHQMRDMLTAILGNLEQLRRQPLDERGRHQLTWAEEGAWRASGLLNRYAPLPGPDQQDGAAEEPP